MISILEMTVDNTASDSVLPDQMVGANNNFGDNKWDILFVIIILRKQKQNKSWTQQIFS